MSRDVTKRIRLCGWAGWFEAPMGALVSLIRIRCVRVKKRCVLGYSKGAQWRFWSHCANAQSDRTVRMHNLIALRECTIWSHCANAKADLYLCRARVRRYVFWRWWSLNVQSTLVISNLLISNNRLSRSENPVPVFYTEIYQQATKYCGKKEKLLLRSNFSSFPQYF